MLCRPRQAVRRLGQLFCGARGDAWVQSRLLHAGLWVPAQWSETGCRGPVVPGKRVSLAALGHGRPIQGLR
jgi:hypothetical protein